jgi:hypothetical protein
MIRLSIAVIVACFLPAIQSLDGQVQTDPAPRLILRIYNYADVPADILKRCERQMDRIFDRFGVDIARLYCPTSPGHLASKRTCSARLGPNQLVIKLLPASMSKRLGFPPDVFGIASPTGDGLPGANISLFFSRVLDLAHYGGIGTGFEDAQAIILGHITAHEVGHLLLGPNSHSATGLMQFPWGRKTLQDMERGRLHFTARQQSEILDQLRKRPELGPHADR